MMILEIYKEQFGDALASQIDMPQERLLGMIEMPPKPEMGDLAFPCFSLAKMKGKAPNVIAQELSETMHRA